MNQVSSERALRLPEVKAITGRSRSQIYADMKAGAFPAGIKIGKRATAWVHSEVQAWLASRIAARAQEGA